MRRLRGIGLGFATALIAVTAPTAAVVTSAAAPPSISQRLRERTDDSGAGTASGSCSAATNSATPGNRSAGITVPLTTIDQPTDQMLADGGLPELHKTGSFGSRATDRLATLAGPCSPSSSSRG